MKTTLPFSLFPRRWLAVVAIAGSLAALAFVTTATGFAQNKWQHHDAGRLAEKMVEHLDEQLDLTRAQEEQITAILADSIEKRQQLRRQRHAPLQALWQQDTLTADEIKAALEKRHGGHSSDKAARREQMTALRAQAMAEIHAVLTPAQRQNSASMLGGHFGGKHGGNRRHGKHGKHGEGHGCDHY